MVGSRHRNFEIHTWCVPKKITLCLATVLQKRDTVYYLNLNVYVYNEIKLLYERHSEQADEN